MKKVAIVLFNLGGPDNLNAVPKFLFNLFNDPAIINLKNPLRFFLAKLISGLRSKTAKKIYSLIGGKSPIVTITNAQAEALEKELSFTQESYKTFVIMRYWHPRAKDVIKKIKEFAPEEIIMMPLYPQFSTTTSGSSFNEFLTEAKRQKLKATFKQICCYPTQPQFISSHSKLIKQAIDKTELQGQKNYRILFSAHGLPQSIVDRGDPYVFQIEKSTQAIVKNLAIANLDYRICYQSKVGRMKWTGPSLDFEIRRAAIEKKSLIIVPIAFVSDHSETLVELDIEYKKLAEELGVPLYLRVAALNSNGDFISSLVSMCKNSVANNRLCSNANNGSRICPSQLKQCPNYAN
jgi:ferrochelatase